MRVLVVEDEPGSAKFVRQGLTEAGYAVDVASDGRSGLDFALAAEYDALVLDIMLPGISGLELLHELRRQGDKTPTLMLTALKDPTRQSPEAPSNRPATRPYNILAKAG